MEPPRLVDRAEIGAPEKLERAWFSGGGRVIDQLAEVLTAFGVPRAVDLAAALPLVVHQGVNSSGVGVIQDPAGSAVGGSLVGAGGVSRQIYKRFKADLMNIPAMPVGSAMFNRSTGPGRRVLHTHAPVLNGDPQRSKDRAAALVALADAYANALFACVERAPHLGDDGALLNLVPVSASLFGGRFCDGRQFENEHLDPSYSFVAYVVAAHHVGTHGVDLPATTMSFYESDVYARAVQFRDSLAAVLPG